MQGEQISDLKQYLAESNPTAIFFIPLTTQQWNTLPANVVNIDCFVNFSKKLNELTN